jgi:hypothetical protein
MTSKPLFRRGRNFQLQKRRVAVAASRMHGPPSATISRRAPPLVYHPFGRFALRSPPHSTPPHHPTPQTENSVFHLRAL